MREKMQLKFACKEMLLLAANLLQRWALGTRHTAYIHSNRVLFS